MTILIINIILLLLFITLLLITHELKIIKKKLNTNYQDQFDPLQQIDLLIKNRITVYPQEQIEETCKNIISKDINKYLMSKLLDSFTKQAIVNHIYCRLLENGKK